MYLGTKVLEILGWLPTMEKGSPFSMVTEGDKLDIKKLNDTGESEGVW